MGPDLGPNCLQKLSADGTSGQRNVVRYSYMYQSSFNSLHDGLFSRFFLSSADFYKMVTVLKKNQEYHLCVKQFGSKSALTFCGD